MNAEQIEMRRNEMIWWLDEARKRGPEFAVDAEVLSACIWLAACYLSRALFRHNLFGHAATQRLAHESRARKYLQQ